VHLSNPLSCHSGIIAIFTKPDNLLLRIFIIMEKLYFYIAIAVIYYGFQAYRKYAKKLEDTKKNIPPPVQQHQPIKEFNKPSLPSKKKEVNRPVQKSKTGPSKPPSSLEELIGQMDKGRTNSETDNKPYVENYEDKPVKKPAMTVDNYVDEEDRAVDKMRKDREAAENLKKDRIGLENEHLAPYSLSSDKSNKYAEMLRNPESLKAAFIAGEILRRKF
jgi:hypothetical protein